MNDSSDLTALITGGAGFIGSHLTDLLLNRGHKVMVLDNFSNGRVDNLKQHSKNQNLQIVKTDVRDREELIPYFEGVAWVFHLAALADIVPSINMPVDYFTCNVDGTFNVLEAARKAGVKRFIYAASSSCYSKK